jgi:hypothetical protein
MQGSNPKNASEAKAATSAKKLIPKMKEQTIKGEPDNFKSFDMMFMSLFYALNGYDSTFVVNIKKKHFLRKTVGFLLNNLKTAL